MVESDPALKSQNGEQVLRSIEEWMVQQGHAAKTTKQATDIDNHASGKDPISLRVLRPQNFPSKLQAGPRQNARLTRARTRKFHRSRARGHLSESGWFDLSLAAFSSLFLSLWRGRPIATIKLGNWSELGDIRSGSGCHRVLVPPSVSRNQQRNQAPNCQIKHQRPR